MKSAEKTDVRKQYEKFRGLSCGDLEFAARLATEICRGKYADVDEVLFTMGTNHLTKEYSGMLKDLVVEFVGVIRLIEMPAMGGMQ